MMGMKCSIYNYHHCHHSFIFLSIHPLTIHLTSHPSIHPSTHHPTLSIHLSHLTYFDLFAGLVLSLLRVLERNAWRVPLLLLHRYPQSMFLSIIRKLLQTKVNQLKSNHLPEKGKRKPNNKWNVDNLSITYW